MRDTEQGLNPMWTQSPILLTPVITLRELFERRNLLRLMVKRNLTARYSRAYLGFGWAVLEPLLFSLIYSFVFSVLVGSSDRLYALNVIVGVIGWNLFARSLLGSANSLYANSNLFSFSLIPKTVFSASEVLTELVLVVIASLTIIPFMIYHDLPLTSSLLMLPIWLIVLAFGGWSFGLLVAPMACKIPDVLKFTNFIVRAGFFLSPVMWTYPMLTRRFGEGIFNDLAHINPVVVPITGMRDAVISTSSGIPGWAVVVGLLIPIIAFLFSAMVFSRKANKAVIGI